MFQEMHTPCAHLKIYKIEDKDNQIMVYLFLFCSSILKSQRTPQHSVKISYIDMIIYEAEVHT